MKNNRNVFSIPLITMLIFVMFTTAEPWGYPLEEELETLYDKRGGTYITITYYEDTFIDEMSSTIFDDGDINAQKIYTLLNPLSFQPRPWIYREIASGMVLLGDENNGRWNNNLEADAADEGVRETGTESDSETEYEDIVFREGPAKGYKIVGTLEHGIKDNEKHVVLDEINNFLLIKTEAMEGWVEKSQVQRNIIMEKLSTEFIRITHRSVNFRQEPSASAKLLGKVAAGEIYPVVQSHESWLKIRKDHQTGWLNKNYTEEANEGIPEEWYQFLQLNTGVSSGISEEEINQTFSQFLSGQGFFEEIGEAFLKAGEVTELNEVYLMALVMENYRESTAILYEGLLVDHLGGAPVEPRTVYNFFGIGALEREPVKSAGETAYEKGWFTAEESIVEGAQWILNNHIEGKEIGEDKRAGNLDTLHKMIAGSYLDLTEKAVREGEASTNTKSLSQEILQSIEQELQHQQNLRIRIKDIYEAFDLINQRFSIPVFEKERYWPVPGSQRLSSDFGYRKDPFEGDIRFHRGIDIPAPTGTPVVAVKSGVVTKNFTGVSYGNLIEIDHGKGLSTRYAHNAENLVKVGDFVKKGDLIATIGSTGRSTGPHLHFELRLNNKALDPLPWLMEEN